MAGCQNRQKPNKAGHLLQLIFKVIITKERQNMDRTNIITQKKIVIAQITVSVFVSTSIFTSFESPCLTTMQSYGPYYCLH